MRLDAGWLIPKRSPSPVLADASRTPTRTGLHGPVHTKRFTHAAPTYWQMLGKRIVRLSSIQFEANYHCLRAPSLRTQLSCLHASATTAFMAARQRVQLDISRRKCQTCTERSSALPCKVQLPCGPTWSQRRSCTLEPFPPLRPTPPPADSARAGSQARPCRRDTHWCSGCPGCTACCKSSMPAAIESVCAHKLSHRGLLSTSCDGCRDFDA